MLITLLLYVPSPRGWECFVRAARVEAVVRNVRAGSARRIASPSLRRDRSFPMPDRFARTRRISSGVGTGLARTIDAPPRGRTGGTATGLLYSPRNRRAISADGAISRFLRLSLRVPSRPLATISSNVLGICKEGDDSQGMMAARRDDSWASWASRGSESSSRAGTLRKWRNQVRPEPDAGTDDKMPDTFYLVRANGTIGALTLRFPPQTSQRRGERDASNERSLDLRVAAETSPWPNGRGFSSPRNPPPDWIVSRSTPIPLAARLVPFAYNRAKSPITPWKIFTSRSRPSIGMMGESLETQFRVDLRGLVCEKPEKLSKYI